MDLIDRCRDKIAMAILKYNGNVEKHYEFPRKMTLCYTNAQWHVILRSKLPEPNC